jgi:superfamily I DNA/RNA helicase
LLANGSQLVYRYFTARVLSANVAAADCDVLLSTVHAAKGAKWDNVVVLDDLVPFAKFKRTGGRGLSLAAHTRPRV